MAKAKSTSGNLEEFTHEVAMEPGDTFTTTIIKGTDDPIKIDIASKGKPSPEQNLWNAINSNKLEFERYQSYIDQILNCNLRVFGEDGKTVIPPEYEEGQKEIEFKRLPFHRTEAYSLLKYATEKYVEFTYNQDNFPNEDGTLNNTLLRYYSLIKLKIKEYFNDTNRCFLEGNLKATFIELIWSYWHDQGMVTQTMHAIARRFQNIKTGSRDPLANFDLDPLRPLNNILWGYIQDAQHRLGMARKNLTYQQCYGLGLPNVQGFSPADIRTKFLQSFHYLIQEATQYFAQSDNKFIRPDGFRLLNALKDTHRILAEGAHNQFGDLPIVARIEMLIEQWILSRPEVREFLGGKIMVPYEEPWMDRVDSMKALQGWDNTSVGFYRDLAVFGEKIILGIRYGNWTKIEDRDSATNWADTFRDAIQRYIHSYYTVTGVDLSAQNVNVNPQEKFLLPGLLIQQKILRDRSLVRR